MHTEKKLTFLASAFPNSEALVFCSEVSGRADSEENTSKMMLFWAAYEHNNSVFTEISPC